MSKKNKKNKSLKIQLIETLVVLSLAFITGALNYLEQKDSGKEV